MGKNVVGCILIWKLPLRTFALTEWKLEVMVKVKVKNDATLLSPRNFSTIYCTWDWDLLHVRANGDTTTTHTGQSDGFTSNKQKKTSFVQMNVGNNEHSSVQLNGKHLGWKWGTTCQRIRMGVMRQKPVNCTGLNYRQLPECYSSQTLG